MFLVVPLAFDKERHLRLLYKLKKKLLHKFNCVIQTTNTSK